MNTIIHVLNLFMIKLTTLALYSVIILKIPTISGNLPTLISAFQFLIYSIRKNSIKHKKHNKSTLVIAAIMFALIPIFKTLTAEISSDTICLNASICHLIYCIASVRSEIINTPTKTRVYHRTYTIPLDQSLLISKNIQAGNEISNIFLVIGTILILSRFKSENDIFFLQIFTYTFYFVIPQIVEILKIHLSFKKSMIYLISVILLIFSGNTAVGIACLIIICSIIGITVPIAMILERLDKNECVKQAKFVHY